VGEANLAHRRLVQVAGLRLTELLEVQRLGVAQQFAGFEDVRFDVFRPGGEGVRLALPEVVDQVDDLVGLQFGGYVSTPRRPPSGRRRGSLSRLPLPVSPIKLS
jgi:hypothetical protein